MTGTYSFRKEECHWIPPAHPRPGPWDDYCRLTIRQHCGATQNIAAVDRKKADEFYALAAQWKRETAILSNLSRIVMHPAYQRIMAMGPDVIPLILRDLSKEEGHWFWALHNLIPEGSDPAEGTTTVSKATRAWLEWGKERHIL